jgi:hypothetical protein
VRRDQRIAGAVLDHIKEHIMLKAEAMSDPMIAAIAGVPPSPPPEGGPAPEGDEPKGNGPVEVPGAPPPEGAELPSLPTNPLTGEEATA